ncbi:MAG: hypothetical protein IRZ08_14290 [Frankia sp.]|nr:hypothetical protein [Frankia sp.]
MQRDRERSGRVGPSPRPGGVSPTAPAAPALTAVLAVAALVGLGLLIGPAVVPADRSPAPDGAPVGIPLARTGDAAAADAPGPDEGTPDAPPPSPAPPATEPAATATHPGVSGLLPPDWPPPVGPFPTGPTDGQPAPGDQPSAPPPPSGRSLAPTGRPGPGPAGPTGPPAHPDRAAGGTGQAAPASPRATASSGPTGLASSPDPSAGPSSVPTAASPEPVAVPPASPLPSPEPAQPVEPGPPDPSPTGQPADDDPAIATGGDEAPAADASPAPPALPTPPASSRSAATAGGASASPVPTSLAEALGRAALGPVEALIDEVVELTNRERLAVGCPALTVDARLAAAAAGHSADMAARGYFSHDTPEGVDAFERILAAGYDFGLAGENIAAGQRTPAEVVAAWMASPAHRANIVNCELTQIGVGYAAGGHYGTYWTQSFATPRS